jgi:hypothetical protein
VKAGAHPVLGCRRLNVNEGYGFRSVAVAAHELEAWWEAGYKLAVC